MMRYIIYMDFKQYRPEYYYISDIKITFSMLKDIGGAPQKMGNLNL